MPAAATSSVMFPVGEDLFKTGKPLPDEEKRYLVHIARTSCKELIKHADLRDDNVVWTPIGGPPDAKISSLLLSSRGGGFLDNLVLAARMYEGRSKRDWSKKFHGGNVMMGACVTQVAATIEEVASFYQRPTTRDARVFADAYQEECLDSHVLYTLVPPSTVAPWHNTVVRWHAVKPPVALGKPRDFCFLETHDEFVDSRGRRGWVLARESVNIEACPQLSTVVRATMQRSGLVFVESDLPGFLNVTQMAVVDLKGTLPRVLSRLATKKYLTEVLRLNRFLHEKRLSLEHILPAHNLVPKRDRTSCHVCVKKFRVFSRHKVRCRKCGEVVCMQCQGVWAIDMSTAASSHNRRASTSSIPSSGVKKVHVRVCINCSQDTRERSMHHKPSILNTQILHTNPASEDEMFALDTMALIPTSHALPDQVLDEDDDISPMDVLQSARSRALHEYVRRTSTASLTSSFLPNHQNPSTAVDSTQSCQARAPQVDSDDDEIEDHVVFRQTKSVPDDTMSYAESSPTSSKDEPQFGPRGLSHSFVSEASSFRPSFTIFKKSTLTTSSQQPVLPSSMLLTSPSYRAMNKDTSPTTFEEESSQHRQLRKPRHHSVHVSTAPTSESTATSTTSSATTSRRGSLPLFSNLAAQVDAALHYGHHTAHVPPPSSHSSTMALLSATSPSLSSSRSSWRHRSSNSLFQSPANRHSHQRRPYTPRKSSQTFQFQDSKLVGMRTSTGTYTSEDLKSIERSLLADAKKYSVAVDTPDSSALSSSARGSSMVLSARGKDSSWTNVRSSTRVGRENNSSFLSSCNHTPATTTSSSLSFSDDDTTLQLEGLREKVQLTLNATSSSTLSSASEPEPDVVALYKQMKALRVAM